MEIVKPTQQDLNVCFQEAQQANNESQNAILQQMKNKNAYPITIIKPNIPTGTTPEQTQVNQLVTEKIWRIVCIKSLYHFYTQEKLQHIVDNACKHDYFAIKKNWNFPTIDMTTDLSILGLFDIFLNLDDSGSMLVNDPSEDNLTRFQALKEVVKTIGFFASMMDGDGICIRFFNNPSEIFGVKTIEEITNFVQNIRPSGTTPLGASLRKIFSTIKPLVSKNEIEKPIIVLSITDGNPDDKQDVIKNILEIRNFFSSTKYGANSVSFGFSQIGSDEEATAFLNSIDTDPNIGEIIDCTSNFKLEQKQCGALFTEPVWIVKSLIGCVDPAYDKQDE